MFFFVFNDSRAEKADIGENGNMAPLFKFHVGLPPLSLSKNDSWLLLFKRL